MVRKSKGKRRKTRRKFKIRKKDKRSGVNRFMQSYAVGDYVHIKIDPSQKGLPDKRFHGKTGKIIGTRGRSYLISVREGGKIKKIIINPEHLV